MIVRQWTTTFSVFLLTIALIFSANGQVFPTVSPFVGPEPISATPSSTSSANGKTYYKAGLELVGQLPYPQLSWAASNTAANEACAQWLMVGDGMMNVTCDVYSFLDLGFEWANSTDPATRDKGVSVLNLTFGFLTSGVAVGQISDVWGFDDPVSGRAYALIGAGNGFSIVDVTVAASPLEVAFFYGSYSVWRDIKTRGNYAYYVQDNTDYLCDPSYSYDDPLVTSYCALLYPTDGFSIVDMSRADSPRLVRHDKSVFNFAHNLFVEVEPDRPFAYVCGGDVTRHGGIAIFSVLDPEDPVLINSYDDVYIHDVVVQKRGEQYILYGAAIYQGEGEEALYLYDVTDPYAATRITAVPSEYRWLHNVWPTSDSMYLYTTHEENGYPLTIWDASDLSNVHEVGSLFLTPGNKDISAHNAFVRDDRLIISYYSMGTVVYDISQPTRPVLVAQYDTWPQNWQNNGGLNGNWGVYPFAAARRDGDGYYLYSSDVDNGLFILSFRDYNVVNNPNHQHLTWFIVVSFVILGFLTLGVVYLVYLEFTDRSLQYEQLIDNVPT